MWDEVLNSIDDKVTPIKAVEMWGGDPGSIVLVSQGINLVYHFKRKGEDAYLRLTHQTLKSEAELSAALKFQKHLQKMGVAICPLLKSQYENDYELITQDKNIFLAHVCAAVPGTPMHFDYPHEIYEKWGSLLGDFHIASKQFNALDMKYGRWENDINELEEYAKHENIRIQTELNTVLNYLKARPQTPQNYGMIHGDHRKGNVLTDGHQIHIIDFDLPRYCWFMDDISRPFFSSILQGHTNWQDKLQPYLEGYRQKMALSEEELSTLPWFMRYKALNMYLWTKYNWEGDIAPGGVNTKDWLFLLSKMILDQGWVSALI